MIKFRLDFPKKLFDDVASYKTICRRKKKKIITIQIKNAVVIEEDT